MPIIDVNGSTLNTISMVHDLVGSTLNTVGTVYDVNGSTLAIDYQRYQIYPGLIASVNVRQSGGNGGLFWASANSTTAVGASGCAYQLIDVSGYSYTYIEFTINTCPTYGALCVGFGNFSSYSLTSWPTITDGYGFDTVKTGNGYYNGQKLGFWIANGGRSVVQVGCAAVARSSASADGQVTINRIIIGYDL